MLRPDLWNCCCQTSFFCFFSPPSVCVKVLSPTLKHTNIREVRPDSETAPVKLPLLSRVTCIAANAVLGQRNTDRTHTRIYPRHLGLVQRYTRKMTARTWCSLWKPSIHRGTELLKYQTQRWIPLQTCSRLFTVGLGWCSGPRLADWIPFCRVHSLLQARTNASFHFVLLFQIALVGRFCFLFFGVFLVAVFSVWSSQTCL